MKDDGKALFAMSAGKAIEALSSDAGRGLTQEEARERLERYGYNEIPEKKENPLYRFLKKFWGPAEWMLEAIILLSWFLGNYDDLYIVTALLIFNAVLGIFQEQRARNAVEHLKKRLQVYARVLRNGLWDSVPARELVPGDIIRLRMGDFVPADVKIAGGSLIADQSALTGESEQMEKNPDQVLYSGSMIAQGEATGVILSTGTETYFGNTVQLVQLARPKLHIEKLVSDLSKSLLLVVFSLLAVAFAFSMIQGFDPVEILPLMLVLLLGAVPVALPAMFTISMAIGSMELVKKGVLITRLSAPDDAARMDILCVDKTGTITMNSLSVAEVIPQNSYGADKVLLFGALASQEANQDNIDKAFISAAREKGLLDGSYEIQKFIPFDPKGRRTEALLRKGKKSLRVMKGAVNVIARLCGYDDEGLKKLDAQMSGLASKGYRTLAVAVSSDHGPLELAGLVALHDPLRADSKELVRELGELGVSVKLLTGDALPIGREIAKEAGIGGNIITVSHLKEYFEQNPAQAEEMAEKSDGFAEIYPGDKYTIVRSLQGKGHVVGMTGDGVNDAPALRQAEVGIAVSNATDVAKGAASVVLTEPGLPHLLEPIRTGRLMFKRINTWVLNKITRTILKTCFIVFAFLITGKYIISPTEVLLMIFMTDFVKIALSTDNVRMTRKPSVWNIPGLTKIAVVLGLLMVVEAFGLLYLGDMLYGLLDNVGMLQTFSFETLFFFAIFSVFVVRERGHFWDSMPSPIFLSAIIFDMIAAAAFASYGAFGMTPIPLEITLLVLGYSFIFVLVVNDLIKNALNPPPSGLKAPAPALAINR